MTASAFLSRTRFRSSATTTRSVGRLASLTGRNGKLTPSTLITVPASSNPGAAVAIATVGVGLVRPVAPGPITTRGIEPNRAAA